MKYQQLFCTQKGRYTQTSYSMEHKLQAKKDVFWLEEKGVCCVKGCVWRVADILTNRYIFMCQGVSPSIPAQLSPWPAQAGCRGGILLGVRRPQMLSSHKALGFIYPWKEKVSENDGLKQNFFLHIPQSPWCYRSRGHSAQLQSEIPVLEVFIKSDCLITFFVFWM